MEPRTLRDSITVILDGLPCIYPEPQDGKHQEAAVYELSSLTNLSTLVNCDNVPHNARSFPQRKLTGVCMGGVCHNETLSQTNYKTALKSIH